MKMIVNNKLYDTEKSSQLAITNIRTKLYKTQNNNYFKITAWGDIIIPEISEVKNILKDYNILAYFIYFKEEAIKDEEAKIKLAEKCAEHYIELFGAVEEA